MNIRVRLSLLLLACALAASCAKAPGPAVPQGPERAWSALRKDYGPAPGPNRSLLAEGVMHYQGGRVSGRATFTFLADLPGAVRLEIFSGFGQVVSMVRETPASRLAYFPDERTAYLDSDPDGGLGALGLPIPFPLRDLARVLAGELAALLPEAYAFAEEGTQGVVYAFSHGPITGLELDGTGRPSALEGQDGAWRVDMSGYPDEDGDLARVARKYTIVWGEKKAFLRITTLTLTVGAWPPGRLELKLPKDTATLPVRPLPENSDTPDPSGR